LAPETPRRRRALGLHEEVPMDAALNYGGLRKQPLAHGLEPVRNGVKPLSECLRFAEESVIGQSEV